MLKYYDFDSLNFKEDEALDKKNIYELEKFVNELLKEKEVEEAKIIFEEPNYLFFIYFTKDCEIDKNINLTDEQKDFIKKFINKKLFDEDTFVIEFRKGE